MAQLARRLSPDLSSGLALRVRSSSSTLGSTPSLDVTEKQLQTNKQKPMIKAGWGGETNQKPDS